MSAGEGPPAKRLRLTKEGDSDVVPYAPGIDSEIIDVKVGPKKIFHLHKNVLSASPFFQNALKPEWTRTRSKKPIELKDDDPDVFKYYVQWLYCHNMSGSLATLTLAQLYTLGAFLMHEEFQDAVIDAFIERATPAADGRKTYPTTKAINTICEGTTAGSPARKLMVDFVYWGGTLSWLDGQTATAVWHEDFVNDTLKVLSVDRNRYRDRANVERPWRLSRGHEERAVYYLRSQWAMDKEDNNGSIVAQATP